MLIEVVEDKPEYAQTLKVEAHQDKVSLFDNLSVGDEVEVSCNLRGKAYTGKDGKLNAINSLVCWKLTKVSGMPF
jgi:hypothetical protein